MTSHRRQIEKYIADELPQSFDSCKIAAMYAALQKDLAFIRTTVPSLPQKKMEMMLHHRHKELAFSYPGLFFRIVRGEVDSNMLQSLLELKKKLDDDNITLDEARNRVIDSAKAQIQQETEGTPRVKKPKPVGTVVQELSFKCKPEDS